MAKTVKVNNDMQKGYSYELTEKAGENFREDFKPQLTPKEMLSLGIMGGKYFNDVAKTSEYPSDWFKDAKLCGIENSYDKSLNYYGVKSGQSLKEWQDAGWIKDIDPRGWIEWYFRYYNGRRNDKEDDRQIKRWINAQRFYKTAETKLAKKNTPLVLLQTCLHWAYDARKLYKIK